MIDIDPQSRTPVYRQICDRVEALALKGIYAPNEQLPSVRSLAKQLGINPNTISKAYDELERNGIIYSIQGRGNFISADLTYAEFENRKKAMSVFSESILSAIEAGISKDDMLEELERIFRHINEVKK